MDPVSKAAHSSNLPRAAGKAAPRAEAGQLTDDLPQGKTLDAEPKHHFTIDPAGHDVDRAKAKSAEQMAGIPQQELDKLTKGYKEHLYLESALQSGMDYQGTSTSANKKMSSAQRTEGLRKDK